MQIVKSALIILSVIVSFSSVLFAQQNKTILSKSDLEIEIQLNKSQGFSPYYGIENEFLIKTNFIKMYPGDSALIASGLNNTPGVIECNLIPKDHFINVKTGKKINTQEKENKIASIEQIKAVLVPFGIEINSYEEIVYKSGN